MYATQEQADHFFRTWKIELPKEPVELHFEPTINTGRSQGDCCVCRRPVAEYGMRWCGWSINEKVLLVHAECYQATENAPAQDPLREVLEVKRSDMSGYRTQLRRVRTPTLFSMVCTYEDADPDERKLWHDQHKEVQLELQERYEIMAEGGIPQADEDLEDAVQSLKDKP